MTVVPAEILRVDGEKEKLAILTLLPDTAVVDTVEDEDELPPHAGVEMTKVKNAAANTILINCFFIILL